MKKTKLLVISSLFAALITVTTAYICHIPIGSGGGYFHLGDTLIYLSASLLPKPYAIAAAIVGGGLADLLTAPAWAIYTVIIKALICIAFTSKSKKIICLRNILALILGCFITVSGYYLAEAIMFGSFTSPLLSVMGNLLQSVLSGILFTVISLFTDKKQLKMHIFKS